jgi:CheY-like chemotaxis protein
VLVVDDDPLNRMLLTTKLQSGPFSEHRLSVGSACTGEEVLEKFQSRSGSRNGSVELGADDNTWRIIFMDEHLCDDPQKLRGSQTMAALRDRGCKALMVSCSGNCTEEDYAAYTKAGADADWPKPYPPVGKMHSDLVRWLEARHERLHSVPSTQHMAVCL